jgi:hypothetical protein
VCRLPAAAVAPDTGELGQRKKGRRRKKGGRAGPDDSRLPRRCMWHGRPGPAPSARAAAGQHGTSTAPMHVARERLAAAPRSQARPKGSPGAYNICQGLFLKIIKKKVKIKKLSYIVQQCSLTAVCRGSSLRPDDHNLFLTRTKKKSSLCFPLEIGTGPGFFTFQRSFHVVNTSWQKNYRFQFPNALEHLPAVQHMSSWNFRGYGGCNRHISFFARCLSSNSNVCCRLPQVLTPDC